MLGQVGPTAYDVRFVIFGIPVRVHPAFWILGTILGWRTGDGEAGAVRLQLILIWLLCLFVSILVHELGHALTAKAFGWPPEIVLCHFGGYAAFMPHHGYTHARSILVSFAGPFAGFLLFGLVVSVWFVLEMTGTSINQFGESAIWNMIWINLGWGIINLLPVLPLDGGQICREVCRWISPQNGLTWSLWIAVVVGGLACVGFLKIGLTFAAIMFGFLAYQSFQALQSPRGPW